jgi:hypothetical protein
MQGVNILYLMLGWLLGLFSPLIADEVKRHCQKKMLQCLEKEPSNHKIDVLKGKSRKSLVIYKWS